MDTPAPLLVESHLYRPTKIEGNDKHPASLGGTDVFSQASILDMYDPDRSQTVTYLGRCSHLGSISCCSARAVERAEKFAGRGHSHSYAHILLADFGGSVETLLKAYPQAKWHVYEPVNRDNVLEGAKLAFGQPVETQYKLEKADVILSLDADFLFAGFPGSRATCATLPSGAILMRAR